MKLILIAALAAQIMQPLAAADEGASSWCPAWLSNLSTENLPNYETWQGMSTKEKALTGGIAVIALLALYGGYKWATQKNVTEQIYANAQEYNNSGEHDYANIFSQSLINRISDDTYNTFTKDSHNYADFLRSLGWMFEKETTIYKAGQAEVQTYDNFNDIDPAQIVTEFINTHKNFKRSREYSGGEKIEISEYRTLLLSSPEMSIVAKVSINNAGQDRKFELFGVQGYERNNMKYIYVSYPNEQAKKPINELSENDISTYTSGFMNQLEK